MPRIRSIKPEFFTSEDVSALELRTRLTWIGLWLHCDDHGRFKDKVKTIKALIWPLDSDVEVADVEKDLLSLESAGRIIRYEADGERYLAVTNWHVHQSINRPTKSKIPAPPVAVKVPAPGEPGHCSACFDSYTAHVALSESTVNTHGYPENGAVAGKTPSLMDDSVSGHGALTTGGEGKGRERRGGEAHGAPPPHCPRHLNNPTKDPCRACGEARRELEAFTTLRDRNERAARSACRQCDGDGWRFQPGGRHRGTTNQKCDHEENNPL